MLKNENAENMGVLNGLDLFSGIGGIGQALAPWVRTRAYCENNRFSVAVLLSRMARGEIDRAPIWDDVTTLSADGIPPIDIIFGGFPCQDISVAGNGAGLGEGTRSGLFREIVRLAGEIRPSFVFLENVAAITIRGGGEVVGAFAELGYDCRFITLAASEIGATHGRNRWWMLAYSKRPAGKPADAGGNQRHGEAPGRIESPGGIGRPGFEEDGDLVNATAHGTRRDSGSVQHEDGRQEPGLLREPDGADESMADAPGRGCGELRASPGRAGQPEQPGKAGLADAAGIRRDEDNRTGRPGQFDETSKGRLAELANAEGIERQRGGSSWGRGAGSSDGSPQDDQRLGTGRLCIGRPPAPGDREGWEAYIRENPTLEPAICGSPAWLQSRNNRIRALGNSVDWLTAREAFKILSGL